MPEARKPFHSSPWWAVKVWKPRGLLRAGTGQRADQHPHHAQPTSPPPPRPAQWKRRCWLQLLWVRWKKEREKSSLFATPLTLFWLGVWSLKVSEGAWVGAGETLTSWQRGCQPAALSAPQAACAHAFHTCRRNLSARGRSDLTGTY